MKDVQIVIGLPSKNAADSIAHVTSMVSQGLAKHFPGIRSWIVNADGSESPDTRTAFLDAPDRHPDLIQRVVTKYHDPVGKGTAVRNILALASDLGAKACALFDSDLQSITPDWVKAMIGPLLEDRYDFITPLYRRHAFDGTITRSIAYPMTRALYGYDVHQPIGGDYGIGEKMLKRYSKVDSATWNGVVGYFGIDIFLTTIALGEKYRIAEADLGSKIHDAKDPASSLGPMFRQVVAAQIDLMAPYLDVWRNAGPAPALDVIPCAKDVESPPEVKVSVEKMVESFKKGYPENRDLFTSVMNPSIIAMLDETLKADDEKTGLNIDQWTDLVYEMVISYHRLKNDGKQETALSLVEAMIPMYLARTASYVRDVRAGRSAEEILGDTYRSYLDKKTSLAEKFPK